VTDTPLDLAAILAAHASASPYGRTEVAGRFHASYYADDADVALVFASVPALVAALRKAEAQVAHWEQAAIDASSEVEGYRTGLAAQVVTRERDASRTAHAALVAGIETGLRESACAECDHDRCATYRSAASWVRDYAALDHHAPTTGATP
jgi:hypothetical protein